MAADGDLTPGELSRRVQELLLQFESLLRKVEERYVQKETLELIREGINTAILGLQRSYEALDRTKADQSEFLGLKSNVDALALSKADESELKAIKDDVDELKDHNKWLFRLVGSFVILAILGAVFAAGGGLGR